MQKALAELIKISNSLGKDPALVQAGSGNISVKSDDGEHMFIKATGTALKDMTVNAGWRRMNMSAAISIIFDPALAKMPADLRQQRVNARMLLACDDGLDGGAGPSIEALLHAMFEKFTVHLHPDSVSAFVNSVEGKSRIEKLYKDEKYPPLWIPYANPGLALAKTILKLTAVYKKQYKKAPTVLFLEKHGLLVTAKTAAAAGRITRSVANQCEAKLKQFKAGKKLNIDAEIVTAAKLSIRKAFFEATGKYNSVSYFCDEKIAAFMALKNAPEMLKPGALAPDELCYANGPALWIEKPDAKKIMKKIAAKISRGLNPYLAYIVKGVGLFVIGHGRTAETIREITLSSLFIRANAFKMGGMLTLSKSQQDYVKVFEGGKSESSSDELAGRISIVTGGGSGIGRSLAVGLARAGATVAIADIDVAAANKTAEQIMADIPNAAVVVTPCNVTNADSVKASFDTLLETFGGLDILVNAAGVAPAYPLTDIPVDKWRFAMEVNLTGYFLMAQQTASILLKQDMGGSMIMISSKSGLEASKNNTPYNASKAGQIHMARGWALELGPNGIRVNSVCPGNVFEGSKIWNP
ncbi:MAG: SDR family oxidoreductase, partial [Anaerohalosphaera sp.]|nr:SDR family oxidoreductase [Anaerohalosphaera sp.]